MVKERDQTKEFSWQSAQTTHCRFSEYFAPTPIDCYMLFLLLPTRSAVVFLIKFRSFS
jgi:hypothetical protein